MTTKGAVGPELNALVATEVMGWCLHQGKWLNPDFSIMVMTCSVCGVRTTEKERILRSLFNPSERIQDAWEVVERMKGVG